MPKTFRILSDLHFEFHPDGGRAFIESLDVQDDEVLLLAGDIAVGPRLPGALEMFCDRFRDVVFTYGNHEFYGTTRERMLGLERAISLALGNLRILDKEAIDLGGGRSLLGCPLWFGPSSAPKSAMSDFRLIHGFEAWVYEENARSVEFLRREMKPRDVVLTHYLPSQKSVAPRWQGSPLNDFFVCDVEALIVERQPALWVHGHTHDSLDYQIGATRVLCNPFGYLGREENSAFDPNLRVTLVSPRG